MKVDSDRELLINAEKQGLGATLGAYVRLSGPGWLQSAITLGGGSLAGSLYLGVLAGYQAMWWQPLAMLLGIVMLSAIAYVTLSTGERPFDAINKHINPVLGWGWAIATMMANLVWCMPQYSLGTAALRQNLAPNLFSDQVMADDVSQWAAVGFLFVTTAIVIWFYDSGGLGVRIFEWVLKGMVGIVVISFFAVVIKMSISADGLDWSQIMAGFVPDFSVLTEPSPAFAGVLAETGEFRDYWSKLIVKEQQDVMITAAATAVGINMTFLLPYSMLRKGWDSHFRGLAIFDLCTGLFIPYLLATSCVIIAAASQFHAKESPGLVSSMEEVPTKSIQNDFNSKLDARLANELGAEAFGQFDETQKAELRDLLPEGDKKIAAMLVRRDAFDLAASLKRLTGEEVIAQFIFGIGVCGMAISTIIILMLINGFVLTEIFGQPENRQLHRLGCFLASVVGALGSVFLWSGGARFWLAVPTSMFGMVLLPIAYATFFMMMNSRSLLGQNMPKGGKRFLWLLLMGLALLFATACCLWSIQNSNTPVFGFVSLGVFLLLALVAQIFKKPAAGGVQ